MKKSTRCNTFSLFFHLLAVTFLFIHTNICAQPIQLPKSKITLGELIQQIERQSDYLFVYNETEIDIKMMLSSVPLKTGDVKSLLHSALVNTPIHYLVENKNIILNTRKHLEEKQTI